MYKKIDGKFYQEVKLEDLSREELVEILKDIKDGIFPIRLEGAQAGTNNECIKPFTQYPTYHTDG